MTRSASDGADVIIPEAGFEWEVVNPHGTGKGHHDVPSSVQEGGAGRMMRR